MLWLSFFLSLHGAFSGGNSSEKVLFDTRVKLKSLATEKLPFLLSKTSTTNSNYLATWIPDATCTKWLVFSGKFAPEMSLHIKF
jgi:hypothetical protein